MCLLLLGLMVAVRPAEAPSHFEQAGQLYEKGKYQEAITLYENMLKAGRIAPGIYFNLGNACFKGGALGRAIYNYRRAERLAPRDPDIQANLRFARDRVSGSVSIETPLWHRPFTYFKINELAGFAASALWVWLILLSMAKVRPSLVATLRAATIAVAAIFGASIVLLGVAYAIQKKPVAIITVQQAVVHLGPLEESQTAFTATDGVELMVEARRDDWVQVSDRSGRSGWIPARDVAVFRAF